MRIKFVALVFIFVLIFSHTVSLYSESEDKKSAVIYFNEACSDCTIYINKVLIKLLEEAGIENIVKKDYIVSDRKACKIMCCSELECI